MTNLANSLQRDAPACSSSSSAIVNKMPGVRCPNCLAKGKEVWVIPGKSCHICHTPCA